MVTPTGTSRADKYRYPKGHPKAGQYAPKSEATKGEATRYVRRQGGRREALEPTGSAEARTTRTADIGRSYSEQAKAYTIKDAAHEAAQKGKRIFIRMGGEVHQIPQDRANDAVAWFTDLGAKFLSAAGANKRGKGYPFSAELHYGAKGILVDMDRLDFFSPELRGELGRFADYADQARDLSGYMERTAATFLGIHTSADDILNGWNEAGTIDTDSDED